MTTFQSIIYAILAGFSEFMPLGSKIHTKFPGHLLGWNPPPEALIAAITTGSFFAIFFYFIHDWASMISSTLQMILYRKRPMTLDERIPLFLVLSCAPLMLGTLYIDLPILRSLEADLHFYMGCFILLGLPLVFFDYWSRKTKSIYHLNIGIALWVGLAQLLCLIPGADRMTLCITSLLMVNFTREGAIKYALLASGPFLLMETINGLKPISFIWSSPPTDLSWLSFAVALIVSFFVGLLSQGALLKHIQSKGMSQFLTYRILALIAIFLSHWMNGN